MALTNPARFGRALYFANLFRVPTWKLGSEESGFPNALGWDIGQTGAQTPSSGRIHQFSHVIRYPMWRMGANGSQFPNALGWVYIEDTGAAPATEPSYGEPFLDSTLEIRTTLGAKLGL